MQDPIVAVAAADATADDETTAEVSVEDAIKAAMATPAAPAGTFGQTMLAKAEFLIFSNYEFT